MKIRPCSKTGHPEMAEDLCVTFFRLPETYRECGEIILLLPGATCIRTKDIPSSISLAWPQALPSRCSSDFGYGMRSLLTGITGTMTAWPRSWTSVPSRERSQRTTALPFHSRVFSAAGMGLILNQVSAARVSQLDPYHRQSEIRRFP